MLYVRLSGQQVKIYPLQIEVYSTVVDAYMSYIVESDIDSIRVASVPLIFTV